MRQRPLLGYKKLKIVGNDQLLPIYEKPNKLITSFERKFFKTFKILKSAIFFLTFS